MTQNLIFSIVAVSILFGFCFRLKNIFASNIWGPKEMGEGNLNIPTFSLLLL